MWFYISKYQILGKILIFVFLFSFSLFLRWENINKTYIIEPIIADAYDYIIIARNLTDNHVFSSKIDPQGLSRSETRPPGYPFFLAGIMSLTNYSFISTILFIQAIIGAMTVILSYFLARFLLPALWSFFVATLVMLSPHMITISAYILTETLFTFLLLLSLVILIYAFRTKATAYYVLAGIVLGMGIFVRPVLALFPLICATILYLYNRREKRLTSSTCIILFLVAAFSLQISWSVWTRVTIGGNPAMSNQIKNALLTGTYPDMTFKDTADIGMPYIDNPEYSRILQGGYRKIARHIYSRFSDEPLQYTKWWLRKPAMLWSWKVLYADGINIYPIRYSWFERNPIMGYLRSAMLTAHPFIVILAFAGTVIFFLKINGTIRDEGRLCYLLCLLLLAHFTLIFTILNPFPRYAIPMGPQLYLMSVFTLWQIRAAWKEILRRVA